MSIDKRYNLYVFDLDGTVVDTREDIARAFTAALTEAGYQKPDMAQVTAAIGGGAKKALERLTGLDGDAVTPLLDRFLAVYGQICADHAAPYPGARALLERLAAQGAATALVTMKAKAPTHKILGALGLSALFGEVIAYEDVSRRKPDPESLLALMDKYGVSPEDTLMVGDTATDMQYAAAAGADSCAMTEGYGGAEALLAENPTYALRSLSEF